MKKSKKYNILVVPGFVCDTYSQIEKAYVDLTSRKWQDVNFIWAVSSGNDKYNRYKNQENRKKQTEPLYVSHLKENGVKYVTFDVSKYNPIRNCLLFRKLFKRYDIDAVFTHFGFERFYAALCAKAAGKKVIWLEHWLSLKTRKVLLKNIFYRIFIDRFIAVSRFVGDTFPCPMKVSVVLNSINSESMTIQTKEESCAMKAGLGIGPEKTIVLMVAAFRLDKRHDLALEICKKAVARNSNLLFIFAGDGPTREAFEKETAIAGLDKSIMFPGHVSNIGRYYDIADICMLTSDNEACANTIFESMLHSVPMVAFAAGGTPEIIKNDYSGVLIPDLDTRLFAQKLLELAGNPGIRKKIGANANYVVIRNFKRSDWEEKMERLIYNAVAE